MVELHKEENCLNPECDACTPYCCECGGCGEVGCDGILSFIKHHVEGKTNCKYESSYIEEFIKNYNELYEDNL
jgi:hypothetical protein